MYSSENPEQKMAYNYFAQVVLLFDSKAEQNEFKKYVFSHLNQLENFISVDANVYNTSDLRGTEKRVVQERLKTGAALNKMLLQWRKLNATSRRSDWFQSGVQSGFRFVINGIQNIRVINEFSHYDIDAFCIGEDAPIQTDGFELL